MSRPQKAGVEYFPLDVENDDKLDLVEAEFGLTGFAVIVKLYQRIYKLGYYCEWNDEVALLFGKRLGLGGSAVSEIVSAAIRRSLFDGEIYRSFGVLTSKGIQKRYFEIVARRKKVEVEQRYLLIPHTHVPDNVYIMYAETPVNDNIKPTETPVNACRSTQSKVKESKVKDTSTTIGDAPDLNPFGDADQARPSFNTPEAYAARMLTGFNSDKAREELVSFLEDLDAEVVRHAIDEAYESGHGNWRYAKAILNRYVSGGISTMDKVLEAEARFKASKQQPASSPTTHTQPIRFASTEE